MIVTKESRKTASEKYNSIDLVKFIMAIFVVSIHTRPFINYSDGKFLNIYGRIVELAVPFFFLASGFFLAIRMKSDFNRKKTEEIVKYQLLKVIRIYIIWTIIYTPLAIWHYVTVKIALGKAVMLYIRGFLFIGEHYNSWPLWYLLSTIYSLSLIMIVLKLPNAKRNLLIMSIVFSFISIGFSALANYEGTQLTLVVIRKLIIYSVANGRIFTGFIYMPIGMLLASTQTSRYLDCMLFSACFMCNVVIEDSIISNYLLIMSSIALFNIIKGIKLKDKKIYPVLRYMSTSIYLIHMYIWSFYYKIFYEKVTYGMDSFIVTSVVAVILSLGYLQVKRKVIFRHN